MKFNLKNLFLVLSFVLGAMVACTPGNTTPTIDDKPDSELDTSVQFVMQYCEDTILTALGQDYSETIYSQSAAIKLTDTQLSAFALNRIIKMSVGLHGEDGKGLSSQYSDLKFWIRDDLNGEDLWSQDF